MRRLGGEFAEADAKVELLQAQLKILNDQLPDAGDGQAARDTLTRAREEIEQLQAQLAQARESEAAVRVDALRQAAETEARELAERELAEASTDAR